jgi:uncharacterized damage-inducible protein DinB
MISVSYVKAMADYNRWQNLSIYSAASELSDKARRLDRGAFFASIHRTLNHLLWADKVWMHRLAGFPKPAIGTIKDSVNLYENWTDLEQSRKTFDDELVDWAQDIGDNVLQGDYSWYNRTVNREVSKPRWLLITHMFNHQTHHRGQVHAMVTAAGGRPDETDLPFKPGGLAS